MVRGVCQICLITKELLHWANNFRANQAKNISKGGFQFAVSQFLGAILKQFEEMPNSC